LKGLRFVFCCTPLSRAYHEARTERKRDREQFRIAHPLRRGRPAVPYPQRLGTLPVFPEWLNGEVEQAQATGSYVADMVKESSKLPSMEAMAFRSMKAHGMHIRVRSAEEDKSTSDSSVTATYMQPARGTEDDANPRFVPVEYVGWVDEILELNYSGHCVIVLLCSWVKAKFGGPTGTVKRDDYGFTLAKVPQGHTLVGPESFAFPINVQQVFYSADEVDTNWKVVCRVDVRSRRSQLQFAVDDSEILNIGRDAEFTRLNREFGNNDIVPGIVPDPKPIYIPDLSEKSG
jgi:hypothetical protein